MEMLENQKKLLGGEIAQKTREVRSIDFGQNNEVSKDNFDDFWSEDFLYDPKEMTRAYLHRKNELNQMKQDHNDREKKLDKKDVQMRDKQFKFNQDQGTINMKNKEIEHLRKEMSKFHSQYRSIDDECVKVKSNKTKQAVITNLITMFIGFLIAATLSHYSN